MAWPKDERPVVHLNAADFAVAVERVVDRSLKNRPVVVAAPGSVRAGVYDMSEEAYQAGVRKGMRLGQARKICPDARVVAPHPDYYERAMAAMVGQARAYSPFIEAGEGNGHLFLDLSGTTRLFGPPMDVAGRLRRAVRADLDIEPIWSVAPNKLLAKVATRIVKPVGEYIIWPGDEETFLRPLPLVLIPGIEGDDARTFREFGLSRVRDALAWSQEQLEVVFGRKASFFFHTFRGRDDSRVRPVDQPEPGLELDHEFDEDTNDQAILEAALYQLVERAGERLRRLGRVARRLGVALVYSDGVRMTRQKTDRRGTASDGRLFHLAQEAMLLAWKRRIRVGRLRLMADRLAEPPAQLELFPEDESLPTDREPLWTALDQIRSRYGRGVIRTGRSLVEAA